jgi:hypothetical protein
MMLLLNEKACFFGSLSADILSHRRAQYEHSQAFLQTIATDLARGA